MGMLTFDELAGLGQQDVSYFSPDWAEAMRVSQEFGITPGFALRTKQRTVSRARPPWPATSVQASAPSRSSTGVSTARKVPPATGVHYSEGVWRVPGRSWGLRTREEAEEHLHRIKEMEARRSRRDRIEAARARNRALAKAESQRRAAERAAEIAIERTRSRAEEAVARRRAKEQVTRTRSATRTRTGTRVSATPGRGSEEFGALLQILRATNPAMRRRIEEWFGPRAGERMTPEARARTSMIVRGARERAARRDVQALAMLKARGM